MSLEDQKQEEPPLDAVLSEEQFQALIHGARAGMPAAFGALLDACRRYLLAIARNSIPTALQSKLDPLALLQDTALDAQRGFANFEGNSRAELFAWLRRVLLNNAAKYTPPKGKICMPLGAWISSRPAAFSSATPGKSDN